MQHAPENIESDTDWIARFNAGNQEILHRLYTRYASELSAYIAARTSRSSEAEDLSQSVWLKIWQNRQSFQQGSFRAWMYRIANNAIVDRWRRKYPQLVEDVFDPAAPEFDQEDERLDALRACLESIEGIFVEIIRCKTQGLSTSELAERFGINSKTVATRIHRGKQLLRECVERKSQ